MTDRKWNKGKPPHVGWWNANEKRSPTIWRWWNGSHWSTPAHEDWSKGEAANCAAVHDRDVITVNTEWSDYYPANARVPRVKP